MKNFFTIMALSFILQINVMAQSHHPQEFLDSIAGDNLAGQKIVEHYCSVCHAKNPIVAIGAPVIGNSIDWQPRLKNGMAKLFENTASGFNAMPARGGCFECSDEQLMLA